MSVIDEPLSLHRLDGVAAETTAGQLPRHLATGVDSRMLTDRGTSPVARRVCAVLKITSALMTAVVVHPGSDSSDEAIVAASRDLMQKAQDMADAMIQLAELDRHRTSDAHLIDSLCAQSAEIVALNWRLSHATGKHELSVALITEMIRGALEKAQLDLPEGGPFALDQLTAQRVALISVIPELHSVVVNIYDYFAPDPEMLVQAAVRAVLDIADYGIQRLNGDMPDEQGRAAVAQALVPHMGALYIQNYRYHARKDVESLRSMDRVERARCLHEYRLTGLPTDHIHESFRRLAKRTIDMVFEAFPRIPSLDLSTASADVRHGAESQY